ncbi:hypothetical protein BJ508DRAFT_327886 [Ascobolus immersus RN42]|uniref:Uncharacterized protein n=1 Tax=Ascobolus immersus RN42 TaxID=1160509 RepID=A0A3N4I1G9_ASCIM|nr:hypothetical protein BJ508DRAFT_327886 [Ascobolus immersus RN42]
MSDTITASQSSKIRVASPAIEPIGAAFYFCNVDRSRARVPKISENMVIDGLLEVHCGSRRPGVGYYGSSEGDGKVEYGVAYARGWHSFDVTVGGQRTKGKGGRFGCALFRDWIG